MKTTKFLYKYILIVMIALLGGACTESWLETEPKGQFLTSNYFDNEKQAFSALVACYDAVNMDYWTNTCTDRPAIFSVAADELHGGGFTVSTTSPYYTMDHFTLNPSTGPQLALWTQGYSGVFRTNYFLKNIDNVAGIDDAVKKRYIAEAKFLRGRFYFDLVTFFKNIPLVLEPLELENVYAQKQVAPELVYAQIEKDMKEAISDLPGIISASDKGRVSQGAAKAYLAKVILFQMDKTRMLEAAALFNEVNKADNVYGYSLQNNYDDIFKVNNKFNSESIFEIPHTKLSNAVGLGFATSEGNLWSAFVNPVVAVNIEDYAGGFGGVPVEAGLANDMLAKSLSEKDPRFNTCIAWFKSIMLTNLAKGITSYYVAGADDTGFFPKKWAARKSDQVVVGGEFFNYPYSYIEMRLADTYLMEAEALIRGGGSITRANEVLNAVRSRVGLPPTTATLDNILIERRFELATEGHRFFDLIRFGKATEVLGSKGFTAGKNEILPIPLTETYNTTLVQNPGY